MTDQDTTPIGLFNFAESYWQSAIALQKAQVRATHTGSVVWYLYYHAIELYLKAYLSGNGITLDELRNKYGHRVNRLVKKSNEFGLQFDDEDTAVFAFMTETDAVIDSRYLRVGYFTRPTHEALDRTCRSIRQLIGTALKENGYSVRGV